MTEFDERIEAAKAKADAMIAAVNEKIDRILELIDLQEEEFKFRLIAAEKKGYEQCRVDMEYAAERCKAEKSMQGRDV